MLYLNYSVIVRLPLVCKTKLYLHYYIQVICILSTLFGLLYFFKNTVGFLFVLPNEKLSVCNFFSPFDFWSHSLYHCVSKGARCGCQIDVILLYFCITPSPIFSVHVTCSSAVHSTGFLLKSYRFSNEECQCLGIRKTKQNHA